MSEIILSADSTCDLGEELLNRYKVNIIPIPIHLGDKVYRDGVDITPDDIYETFEKERILPKTSALNVHEYLEHFKQWTDQGKEVIHISLGSGISSTHQNARLAAEEVGNVHVIDSGNLSTGMGFVVIETAKRIAEGLPASQIVEEVNALKPKIQASFIIDTLTYLYEGGRCSALASISASILNIKPCIEVDNSDSSMSVGKKYRGSLQKVLRKYTNDKLKQFPNINLERIFITHSGTDSENIELVKQIVEETYDFKEIHITRAGCTISSHCGPNTLGVLFMTN